MHDLKNKRLPNSFNDFAIMNRNNMDRITRQSHLFYTGRPRTNFSMKLPNHSFPRVWNSFDQDTAKLENKKKIQK